MSIASAFFAGILATILTVLGIKLIGQRQGCFGWALILIVILSTVLGGYVSFSLSIPSPFL